MESNRLAVRGRPIGWLSLVLLASVTACSSDSGGSKSNGLGGNPGGGGSNIGMSTAGAGGQTTILPSGDGGNTSNSPTGTSVASTSKGGSSNAATGGTSALPTGGTTATAGTTSTVSTGTMRNLSSAQLVKEMRLGWNLGNTLDSTSDSASIIPDETYWGNPKTTPAMLNAVKAAGFNTVRVPTTWQRHMGNAPNYTVDAAWMARVEEVVSYVLSTGMYAIVNSHHDEWVDLSPTANQTAVAAQLSALWTQIASRLKNYDDHLVFEVLNEPRLRGVPEEWTGGTPAARKTLNAYNLAAVNAIRATGGNNASRHIMVPTHGANASDTCINELSIPNNDAKVIVSLHTYYPWNFSAASGATTFGTPTEIAAMKTELDRIANLLPKKGRAVVIGEWGSVNQNNTSARVTHARAYSEAVIARGMAALWWDNGAAAAGTDGFGLLNRKVNPISWFYPEIVQALTDGATAGASAAP